MASSSPPRPAPQSSSSDVPVSVNTSASAATPRTLRLRPPRSLPPWIDSYDQKLGSVTDDQFRLLNPPARSVQPQHNSLPAEPQRRVSKDGFVDWDELPLDPRRGSRAKIPLFLKYGRASKRGRTWDHLRSAEPVIVSGYAPTPAPPTMAWQDFLHSSSWGHMPNEESEIVGQDTLNKLQPTFDRPVDFPTNPLDPRLSRRRRTLAFSKRLWNLVIRHSLAPLVFRLTVMVTSALALGIACRIFELANAEDHNSAERTQSIVTIVVDSMAIPYIGYMIWDEYTGKPLGLRPALAKIALILLDLFFIIFKSASTALAFQSLVYHDVRGAETRDFASALAVFMLVGLIAWTMNFIVNIFRTVERLGGGEDDNP